MKLRVQYMAQLRAAIGQSEEQIDLTEGTCLGELLSQLAITHATARTHLVTDAGQARPSLLIVVNETVVPARDAATTMLHSEDVVTLMPPIAGG